MAKDQKDKKGAKPTADEIAARKAAAAKRKADAADDGGGDEQEAPAAPAPTPRLIAHYQEKVVPALKERFGYQNMMAVPKLEKIIISMGLGKYGTAGGEGKGKIEQAERELSVIAGQKPLRTKAKKSVANFKLREGMDVGLKVTLRGARMWEFLDRVITLAIPRVKDFRGLSPDGFDKEGNYNFGFTEQSVFPEVDAATITFQQGMNITIVSSANSAEEGRELLKGFGFPFRTPETDKR
jgi:large subunit ribosomal protein L5